MNLKPIAEHIGQTRGETFVPDRPIAIGGGCINRAIRLSDNRQSYFIKLNDAHRLGMFEAERDGLDALAATQAIRVPQPLCCGVAEGQAYLVMEYIEMGHARLNSDREAGEQLAAMHRHSADSFGWRRDNVIGLTQQKNRCAEEWAEFWREQRLGYQLALAASNGYGGRLQSQGEKLLELVPVFLNHSPVPSLLHGDLWGGNMAYDLKGHPVIYDPAVYYGDREADLAMTELFGGFSADFYAAYRELWPLDSDFQIRKTLYNLYHILNHLNLFGGGYLSQAQGMVDHLLAEVA